jgi:DNA-binding GntR family transcriptional regulator
MTASGWLARPMSDDLLSDNRTPAAAWSSPSMPLSRPDTLTTVVASYVKDAIIRREFMPGSRLPEVALARELETSRGTVREALRSLADGGLVEVIPRRGVFVSQLSVRAVWEITSLRALLEPYAARLALEAHGSDPAMQAEVQEAFDVLRHAVGTADPAIVADADVGFHRAVFQRCGHDMLLNRLDTLQVLSRRVVLTNQLSSADAPTLIAQHEPIAAAVELCDPELLEGAVRTHVIEGGELLMTRMAPLEPHRGRKPAAHSFGLGRWPSGTIPHPRPPAMAAGTAPGIDREVR